MKIIPVLPKNNFKTNPVMSNEENVKQKENKLKFLFPKQLKITEVLLDVFIYPSTQTHTYISNE